MKLRHDFHFCVVARCWISKKSYHLNTYNDMEIIYYSLVKQIWVDNCNDLSPTFPKHDEIGRVNVDYIFVIDYTF